jgi:hypothetical protein
MAPRAALSPVPAGSAMTAARSPGAWRDLWDARRARLWIIACAVAAWLPAVGVAFRGWLDFSAFYAAAHFAFTPDLARLEPVVLYQLEHGLPITPYVYPAGVALLYVPLSLLPYGLAGLLHLLAMLGLLLLALRLGAGLLGLPTRWALLGGLAWAPAAAGVLSGQNTSLALLLVVLAAGALASAERSQGLAGRIPPRLPELKAGASIGLLAYKAQLAAPLAGLLALRGRIVGLLVVGLALLGHYLLGVLATGGNLAWPADWLATLRAYAIEDFRANGWQAVSLPALATRIDVGLGSTTLLSPLSLLGYLVAALVVLACLPALRRWGPISAVALACAAGLVINPHAWVYDATLLLPAIGLFASRAAARGWPWSDRWLLALAYGLAVTWPLGGLVGFVPLVVVVTVAPLVLVGIGPLARFGPAEGEGTTRAGAV